MSIASTSKNLISVARERVVDEAIHSASMEGLTVTPATRVDAEEYAHGAIGVDELLDRVRTRHSVA